MKKQLFLLSVLTILLSSCTIANNSSSESSASSSKGTSSYTPYTPSGSADPLPSTNDIRHRNYYQLLVYSFADSNNDGWGDFKGIADKLDYLQNLGINGLWLSPFLVADDYHGYNVKDYYKVDSRYEVNNYKIENFLEECHRRDIKVLMDLVLNHTSVNHTWYKDHRDWYSGPDAFGGNMKDLNYNKKEVVDAVKEVGKHWLNKGIDGFRLDAAMWIYNTYSGVDHNKNYAFWNDWCQEMRKAKEDVYIIGEVLDSNHDLAYEYAKAGFDATFDFNAPGRTYELVNNSSYSYASNVINDYKKITKDGFVSARALSNHDIGRFSQDHPPMDHGETDGKYFTDKKKLILSNAINAVTPGATFIYYGDELGLQGSCPNGWNDMSYRTPMPWDDKYLTKSKEYYKNYKGGCDGTTTSKIEGNDSLKLSSYIAKSDSIYKNLSNILKAKLNNEFLRNASLTATKDSSIFKDGISGFSLTNGNYKIHFLFNGNSSAKSVSATNVLASTVNNNNGSYSLGQYDYLLYYQS